LEMGSQKLFAWGGLEIWSSWSQPPRQLGLQAWATNIWHPALVVFKRGKEIIKSVFSKTSFWGRWSSSSNTVLTSMRLKFKPQYHKKKKKKKKPTKLLWTQTEKS
jgi:hypothetical protein